MSDHATPAPRPTTSTLWRIVTPSGIPVPGTRRDTAAIATAAYALIRRVSWPELEAQGYSVVAVEVRHV